MDDDVSNPSTEAGESGADPDDELKEVFVYHAAGHAGSSSYIDAVILRDRDANTAWEAAGDGTLEERVYDCQNWRADVVHLIDDGGTQVESIRYSAYGVPTNMLAGDIDGDGSVGLADVTAHNTANGTSVGNANYTSRADIDLDGDVDVNDYNAGTGALFGAATGRGTLSPMPDATPDTGNRKGYAGYEWDPVVSKWHVRHRVLDPVSGRWTKRDPAGYVDGGSLYGYARGGPMTFRDWLGLYSRPCLSERLEDCGWGTFMIVASLVGLVYIIVQEVRRWRDAWACDEAERKCLKFASELWSECIEKCRSRPPGARAWCRECCGKTFDDYAGRVGQLGLCSCDRNGTSIVTPPKWPTRAEFMICETRYPGNRRQMANVKALWRIHQ